MSKVIMIGCDLHDTTTVLKIADGPGASLRRGFLTSKRAEMIVWLKELAAQRGAERIVFAYEASGRGFGLHDDLTDAGIECHVLAPTHLPHTSKTRKNKTDDNDAEMILDEVRAHVLAGRKLPDVWIPDLQTRDDRETVRMRLEVAEQRTRIKNQMRTLGKRCQLEFPEWFSGSGEWSKRSVAWLEQVIAGAAGGLGEGARTALRSLLALYRGLTVQLKELDQAIKSLSQTPRYARAFRKLQLMPGVGTLTALVFLTEMGNLDRFQNRRQVGAYLGLAPSSFESGQRDDRKGHITRQGPSRVRHVLCQAAWSSLRCSEKWRERYDRIKRGSKGRSKPAIVAIMRQLGVAMWQAARSQELDELLDGRDPAELLEKGEDRNDRALEKRKRKTTSARAQRKGGRPSRIAVAPAQLR